MPHNRPSPEKIKPQEDDFRSELYIIERCTSEGQLWHASKQNFRKCVPESQKQQSVKAEEKKEDQRAWGVGGERSISVRFKAVEQTHSGTTMWHPCVALEIPDLSSVSSLQSPWRWLSSFVWSLAFAAPAGSRVTANAARSSERNRCSYNRIVLQRRGARWGRTGEEKTEKYRCTWVKVHQACASLHGWPHHRHTHTQLVYRETRKDWTRTQVTSIYLFKFAQVAANLTSTLQSCNDDLEIVD